MGARSIERRPGYEQGGAVGAVATIQNVTDRRHPEHEAVHLTAALAESFLGTTEAISKLLESRDPYAAGHSKGVAELATRIAHEMGMEEEDIRGLRVCALLHDIGKVVIPFDILYKHGPLSEYEWGIIEQHPGAAYRALRYVPYPWPVAEVVYHHHERLDGSGYPLGLKGDDIHPWACILAVADVADAMINHRLYRSSFWSQDVFDKLKEGRKRLYDAQVVDVCMSVLSKQVNRVLVVEDEPTELRTFVESLRYMKMHVKGFEDPQSALQHFKEHPFPVVITDLKMPGMHGLELLKKVREIHPHTKVIVITAWGKKRDAMEALRLGAANFLEKPLTGDELRAAVTTALRRFREEKGRGFRSVPAPGYV